MCLVYASPTQKWPVLSPRLSEVAHSTGLTLCIQKNKDHRYTLSLSEAGNPTSGEGNPDIYYSVSPIDCKVYFSRLQIN